MRTPIFLTLLLCFSAQASKNDPPSAVFVSGCEFASEQPPSPREILAIAEFERVSLPSFHVVFQRNWRKLDGRIKRRWMSWESELGERAMDYRAALGEIRSAPILRLVLLRLRSEFSGKIPSSDRFAKWVQHIRAEIPVLYKITEVEQSGKAPGKLEFGGKESRYRKHFRPELTRPISEVLVNGADEFFSQNERGELNWFTGELLNGSQNVRAGKPSPIAKVSAAEHFYLQMREIEEEVLEVMVENGVIDDAIPELLSGDELFSDQVALYDARSFTKLPGKQVREKFAAFAAAGRNPYPISYWTPDFPGELDGPGTFVLTEAVIRTVRNLRFDAATPGKPAIILAPLQWERSLLSESKRNARLKLNRDGSFTLRYELGRAYGRTPLAFLVQLLMMVRDIGMEIQELVRRGVPIAKIELEAHASIEQTRDYYVNQFGFTVKNVPGLPAGHWIVSMEYLEFAHEIVRKLHAIDRNLSI